ncbi:hypothetical protein GPAL_2444 [Glaciecola pallidula DSM 14239 = ACAM 615]|uniref:Uncharacterized protein n=1 Tax=Brumicola pallidula DSM 14239 = ACAM 615 TaxID=1121922 RepID=K7A1E4_9ALTE|nr:hypothetical protein GPAL_2444 [Glaciecola pallidula DSM 14239 = ACAM 615]
MIHSINNRIGELLARIIKLYIMSSYLHDQQITDKEINMEN